MLNREKLLIVGDEPVVRSMTTAQGPAPRVRNQAVSTASSGARTSRVQHSTETFRSAFEIPVKIQLANGKSLDVSLCRVSDGLFLLAATAWVRRGQSVQVL